MTRRLAKAVNIEFKLYDERTLLKPSELSAPVDTPERTASYIIGKI